MFCLRFLKGSECLKYVFLLKGLFTFKFRILYFYMLCLFTLFFVCLLRLTLYCQNLVVRFVICSVCHKMLRNTTTTTGWGRANATWEPGEPWLLLHCLTFSNFSGVCVCDLLFTLVICQHKKARFLIRFFLFTSVLFYFYVSFRRLL